MSDDQKKRLESLLDAEKGAIVPSKGP